MKKLFMISFLLLFINHSNAQTTWTRITEAIVDGDTLSGAYCGGFVYTKPTFADIDADGDQDMFLGHQEGYIAFFRNDGNAQKPKWTFISEKYDSILVYFDISGNGGWSDPEFCDIDNDSDFDLFLGQMKRISDIAIIYYQNNGNSFSPLWEFITYDYLNYGVTTYSTISFVDIDADQDHDIFTGGSIGRLYFFENIGTSYEPNFTYITQYYEGIDVGGDSDPDFVDIDADGDYDMFIGGSGSGVLHYYRNDGTPEQPQWSFITDHYNNMDFPGTLSPEFVDIDADGDYDLFVGEYHGDLNFFENIGKPYQAQWQLHRQQDFLDFGEGIFPTLIDIDADGDQDLFIGSFWTNRLIFMRNDGTPEQVQWTFVTNSYGGIQPFLSNLSPFFVDIDADGDYDLFLGTAGTIVFYQNNGTPQEPIWKLISEDYTKDIITNVYPGSSLKPTFADIDADGDYDLFIGNSFDFLADGGRIHFVRNDGNTHVPDWTFITNFYGSIDVGDKCIPTFYDIDQDNDFDLFIGNESGNIYFYQNDGTPQEPQWIFVTDCYNGIDVGLRAAPFFADVDNDGDKDLFIGEWGGGINLYRNETISSVNETTSPLTPKKLKLHQNYPNPFNAQTVISYHIGSGVPTKGCLKIYNLLGKEVRTFILKDQRSGPDQVVWDGKDHLGNLVASGIYFYILEIGELKASRRLIFLK